MFALHVLKFLCSGGVFGIKIKHKKLKIFAKLCYVTVIVNDNNDNYNYLRWLKK